MTALKRLGGVALVLASLYGGGTATAGETPTGGLLSLWVQREYTSWDNPLHSELSINDKPVGTFTSDTDRPIAEHLKPGGVFWDVGAHAGFMAVLADRLVGPQGRVECFEPVAENVAILERNLDANGSPKHIHQIAPRDHAAWKGGGYGEGPEPLGDE